MGMVETMERRHKWSASRIAYELVLSLENPPMRVAGSRLSDSAGPRPAPAFVEWLMSLPPGWVTDPALEFAARHQTSAFGNGVMPLQAVIALARAESVPR